MTPPNNPIYRGYLSLTDMLGCKWGATGIQGRQQIIHELRGFFLLGQMGMLRWCRSTGQRPS